MSKKQLPLTPPLWVLVQRAVALLQRHAPADGSPYYGCFSGGKDSVVIKELARLAVVPVEWHYNVIIDPPELMRFIKQHHPDVKWEYCRHGPFFRRMREKLIVPTRWRRWCCAEYKHLKVPKGCARILGVRIEESAKRRSNYTACAMPKAGGRTEVYPIRLWPEFRVWEFIRKSGIPYCSLYDEGFTRLGCVGCPLTSPKYRRREFDRWPHFEKQWRKACKYVVEERAKRGLTPPPDSLIADWQQARLIGG